jgi:plasmid stabilization system protein ParE
VAAYRLGRGAEADIVDVLAYTEANFGEAARVRYERRMDVTEQMNPGLHSRFGIMPNSWGGSA